MVRHRARSHRRSGPPPFRGGWPRNVGRICGRRFASPLGARSFPLLLAYLPFLWLALFFGVVAAAGRFARDRGWQGIPWIAFVVCAGVAMEWLTTFSPLPLNIALCQYRNLPVIQLAAFTGIWGVSFLLWLINAAVADAILSRKRPTPVAICAAGVALVVIGAAASSLAGSLNSSKSAPSLMVAAVQDYSAVETADVLAETQDEPDAPDRATMTKAAVQRGAELVVWSEEALASAYQPNDPRDETNALASETKACLVVGYSDDHEPHPHNCAGLIYQMAAAEGSTIKLIFSRVSGKW